MAGPAVEATKQALYYYGPSLLTQQYYEKHKKPPGFLDRLQGAAGPHKTGADPHIAGRALDIILFAKDPQEKDFETITRSSLLSRLFHFAFPGRKQRLTARAWVA